MTDAEKLAFLRAAVARYLESPGCNNGSRVTALAKLQWALDQTNQPQQESGG